MRERRLLGPGDRVLVAVSGGPDSMALLDVLARLAPELDLGLEAASVDHGLRAGASQEIALAAAHAARLGLPHHVLRVELAARGSVQARARTARYAALRDLAGAIGASRIAVGHTRDDQAETVIARLLRGSGLRGLAGIAPRRADGVIRPLIDASRRQTRSWCEAHDIAFAEDPSNIDGRFQRARIRARVLPALQAENAAIGGHLAALADDARALAAMVSTAARGLLAQACGPDGSLDRELLRGAPAPVRREALRVWAQQLPGGGAIRRPHLDAMDLVLQGKGQARLPGGWTAVTDGDRLRAARSASSAGGEAAANE